MVKYVVAAVASSICGVARADYLFDSISNFTALQFQTFISVPVHAEETILDPSHGLAIDSVELLCHVKSSSYIAEYIGTVTVQLHTSRVYTGTNMLPGSVFYEAVQPVDILRGTDQVVAFSVPHITAPSTDIWTSWYFTRNGQTFEYSEIWVRETGAAAPAAGTFGPHPAATSDLTGVNSWGYDYDQYAVRIGTVPTPGAWMMCGAASIVARRRKR